ncbi:hypothetical protein OPV22_032177 [Ensete ventricosum]|uniref:Uncharacterized protein n=1 Tax=Ensete ventricosum TaxID=4639 RepID=A0AAV8NZW4_ENSVE|nr:hypothetical protein OPV22_032177 [Ensete ventricosum]
MERLAECDRREAVRNTMLKHEEIFKQQVYELHRLYRDQKLRMAELRNNEFTVTGSRIWSSASSASNTSYSLQQCAARSNAEGRAHVKGFDLEQPAEECSSNGATSIDEETTLDEVELTLSIGCSAKKKKKKKKQAHWLDPRNAYTRCCSEAAPSGGMG